MAILLFGIRNFNVKRKLRIIDQKFINNNNYFILRIFAIKKR